LHMYNGGQHRKGVVFRNPKLMVICQPNIC
jgi:hypothetical protein